MDTNQLLHQLDNYYRTSETEKAEVLLNHALSECERTHDHSSLLTVYNELMGLYRETGRCEQAIELTERALKLVSKLSLNGTTAHGTTLLNGATACRVSGQLERALAFYLQAETIFLKNNQGKSYLMASLYNNVSQLYQDRQEYKLALEYQQKALSLIQSFSDSASEIATTLVNMSYSYMALEQLDEATALLEQAMKYYENSSAGRDSHYGAALSAMGQLAFQKGNYHTAAHWLQKALQVEKENFGENDACRIIRTNLDHISERLQMNH